MESKNYYDILEVSVKASAQEITLAKNKLAKRYHPDVNMRNGIDTTDKMQEILEAYLVLSDPVKRAEYDREIRGNRPSKMQTFNLYEESEEVEDPDHPTFVTYWKAAGALYDIIEQSNALFRQKRTTPTKLGELADPGTASYHSAARSKNSGALLVSGYYELASVQMVSEPEL